MQTLISCVLVAATVLAVGFAGNWLIGLVHHAVAH